MASSSLTNNEDYTKSSATMGDYMGQWSIVLQASCTEHESCLLSSNILDKTPWTRIVHTLSVT